MAATTKMLEIPALAPQLDRWFMLDLLKELLRIGIERTMLCLMPLDQAQVSIGWGLVVPL